MKMLLQFGINSNTLYGSNKRGIVIEGRKSELRYSRINLVAGKIDNTLIGSMGYCEKN